MTLQWRHNKFDVGADHRRLDCLLNRLLSHRSKKTSKLRITYLCEGNHQWSVDSPHKGQVTRKMIPFDDVIMVLMHIASEVKSGPDASWDKGKLRVYSDMASKIAGNSIIYSIVFQANIKGKNVLLVLCDRNPPVDVGSPYKRPVMRKMCPCHDIIMNFYWS